MKSISTISFILFFGFNVQAQTKPKQVNKLVGVWQVNTAILADAWNANYRFYKDGTFKYTFNSYDDRGRIRQAIGTYRLHNNELLIVINARKELVGGDLVGGNSGFQQEELVLEGAKMVEVYQKVKKPINFNIEWFVEKGVKGFSIQNNKYYLVSTDPHNQED